MFFKSTNQPWVAGAILAVLILGMAPLFLSSPRGGASFGAGIDPEKVVKTFPPRPAADELAGKEAVKIGVYILSVGNLDTTTSRYTVDFFLNFVCETENCDPRDFDLINAGAGPEIEDQTDESDFGRAYYYRVRATMRTNLDLRDFPFDKHVLEIEIEDKNKTDNEFVYIADPALSGIDSSVYVSGWNLEPSITGEVNTHVYDVYNESYSRARFFIRINHPWFSSFMKGLFAAIVIVGVGMLSFLMSPTDAKDRIALTSGTLASAIFYHMTLTSSIPPVGYLTYADRFMILQYLFITASLAVAIGLFLMQSGRREEKDLQQLHRATRISIPLLWVISMIVLHVTTIGI
ncbi:MAG: hypothetical protein HXY42_14710 [Chloroflexi bacterium]|nr:hypothetical protein [Chloroflexota bacterium]